MNPATTRRFRRLTGLLAVGWALLAIGMSVSALFAPRSTLTLPVNCSFVGASAMVEAATDQALEAGVRKGDRLLSIDGKPVTVMLRSSEGRLVAGHSNVYRIQKRNGEIRDVSLPPAPREFTERPVDTLIHLGLLFVSISYLAIGMVVWWNRPTAAETWAMMIFCATMAVMIATAIRVHLVPWSAALILANMPWLGAATFHLFTTYPIEPRWIVRHRRIRGLPYAAALAISASLFVDEMLGLPVAWLQSGAFLYGVLLSLVSLGVLVTERRRAHDAGFGDRADLMLVAGIVSLLPILVILLVEYFLQLSLPWYLALLWVGLLPRPVGYGMVRRQLFEFRIVAKSSAAYGAVTLGDHRRVRVRDHLRGRGLRRSIGVNERAVQVAFLFFAILAFNPLRDRMQRLVDTLLRSRPLALSARRCARSPRRWSRCSRSREIGDRILVALTDTMGVERAMVLIVDETENVLAPVGLARRVGRGRHRTPRSRRIIRSGSISGCAARSWRAPTSTTRPTRRSARPAGTSSTPSRSSCWFRSSSASTCWA